MKAYDVLGYTADADTYCPTCTFKRYGPEPEGCPGCNHHRWEDSEGNLIGVIFADSEWDTPIHCSDCGAFIPVQLTSDGREYVREQAALGPIPHDWWEQYGEC